MNLFNIIAYIFILCFALVGVCIVSYLLYCVIWCKFHDKKVDIENKRKLYKKLNFLFDNDSMTYSLEEFRKYMEFKKMAEGEKDKCK